MSAADSIADFALTLHKIKSSPGWSKSRQDEGALLRDNRVVRDARLGLLSERPLEVRVRNERGDIRPRDIEAQAIALLQTERVIGQRIVDRRLRAGRIVRRIPRNRLDVVAQRVPFAVRLAHAHAHVERRVVAVARDGQAQLHLSAHVQLPFQRRRNERQHVLAEAGLRLGTQSSKGQAARAGERRRIAWIVVERHGRPGGRGVNGQPPVGRQRKRDRPRRRGHLRRVMPRVLPKRIPARLTRTNGLERILLPAPIEPVQFGINGTGIMPRTSCQDYKLYSYLDTI